MCKSIVPVASILWFICTSSALAQPTMYLVPVSAESKPEDSPRRMGWAIVGNEITLSRGGRSVWLEVRVTDWDPGNTRLRVSGFAAALDLGAVEVSCGLEENLTLYAESCTSTSQCENRMGDHSTCAAAPIGGPACSPAFINRSRADYIFKGLPELPISLSPWFDLSYAAALDPTRGPSSISIYRCNGGLEDGNVCEAANCESGQPCATECPGLPDFGVDHGICAADHSDRYLGTLVLDVPPDIHGTFTVNLKGPPATGMLNESGAWYPATTLVPAKITVGTADPMLHAPKNRYLTVKTCTGGGNHAIRVTFLDLPAAFATLNGQTMWVGMPEDVQHYNTIGHVSILGFFKASTLRCSPLFTDWDAFAYVDVFHRYIIPDATYGIEVFDDSGPDGQPGTVVSELTVATSRWGDSIGRFDSDSQTWTEPDGIVAIQDALAQIQRFINRPSAPTKVHGDIMPEIPDQDVEIRDILQTLLAFQQRPYPFEPGPPPCD